NVTGDHLFSPLFHGQRPPLPEVPSVSERARLCDVLAYIHERLGDVLLESHGQDEPADGSMNVPWHRWQNLQLLTRDLAQYLKEVVNPDDGA
ncbi:MAG: hypothetical protein KDA85_20605, partial [Planctomycetaceae bacterium]|nr:hypothetical protein [Planctomycetaceae bacterium]